MKDLFYIISETTIRTISLLIRGFDHFPLSSDCKSSSGNLFHGIKKVSTQSTLGLWQFLEEVEDEILGEDSKDTEGPSEATADELSVSGVRPANIHTSKLQKKKHVNDYTSLDCGRFLFLVSLQLYD